MRYKIQDTDTGKEYYRKRLPRKAPNKIQTGVIYEVEENVKVIGVVTKGNKVLFQSMRTT